MKIRHPQDVKLSPPDYDANSKDFTLSLHYGGKFHIGDLHAYVRSKVVGESSKKAMLENARSTIIGVTSDCVVGPMTRPVESTTPSMFEQFQSCQLPTQGVNISAPAPFVGRSFIRSVETCVTHSCTTAKEIITEEGRKYATLSSLSSITADIRGKKKQN